MVGGLTSADVHLLKKLDQEWHADRSIVLYSCHSESLSEIAKKAISELGSLRGLRVTFPLIGTQHTVYAVRAKTP